MVNCGIMSQTRPFVDRSDSGYFARRDVPFPTNGLEARVHEGLPHAVRGRRAGTLTLPYLAVIRKKLGDIDINFSSVQSSAASQASECYGILQEKLTNPCLLELIWSYWHEEGMLVQTMNAITRRFQNVRGVVGAGSARQPRDRSAAAAEQPALGLRPGRTAPAERRPAQLRVRPPLRHAARWPRRPGR